MRAAARYNEVSLNIFISILLGLGGLAILGISFHSCKAAVNNAVLSPTREEIRESIQYYQSLGVPPGQISKEQIYEHIEQVRENN